MRRAAPKSQANCRLDACDRKKIYLYGLSLLRTYGNIFRTGQHNFVVLGFKVTRARFFRVGVHLASVLLINFIRVRSSNEIWWSAIDREKGLGERGLSKY